MRKIFYLFYLITGCLSSQAQPTLNLNFEKISEQGKPLDWIEWGSIRSTVDSIQKISGKYSLSLTSTDSTAFGSIAYSIPTTLQGKEITIEGFIKTKNVVGQVGLLIRIDRDKDAIEFDNMSERSISGTTNWNQYKITLPYHNDADAIYIGGVISGTGQVWFDNFTVLIDGININDNIEISQTTKPAAKDKEFDHGSNFYLNDPTTQQIEKIEKLALIWSFLKYNSAEVAKGCYNFDYELFRKLAWLNSPEFDTELNMWKNKLTASPPFYGSHYYLDFKKFAWNPVITNETTYPNMKFDDDGLKLVALFRYWSIIDNLFPYKQLTDSSWSSILKKYIPKFLTADDELSYKLTLLELFKETGDSHAALYNLGPIIDKYFGLYEVPILAKIINDQVIVTDFKNIPELKRGDQIISFDKLEINNRINNIRKYVIASNTSSEKREILSKLFCTNKDSVIITYERKNKIFSLKAKSSSLKYFTESKPSHTELADHIIYIYPGSLQKNEIIKIIKNYKNTKGLIFDLRCYPSDFIVYSATKLLLPKPKEFAQFSFTDLKNISHFKIKSAITVGSDNPDYYKGKVAVLINEATQSNAEFTVMALQTLPNVKIIGSQTAGADGDVTKIILPGDVSTMMSGIGVYYPDSRQTQRIGIVPDIQILPTREGIENNEDELLQKAILYIKNN